MKILVTAFEPFGGELLNPSEEVLKLLPENIGDACLLKYVLPTAFYKARREISSIIDREKPDVIISLGQAGGRRGISIERVAINIRDARIPDNAENRPEDEIISEDGENAYFSTLPMKKIVSHLKEAGFEANISNSAGTFVCNEVMYTLLEKTHASKTIGGFIHIPYCEEQVMGRENVPFMTVSDMARAIQTVIEFLTR